MSLIRRIWRKIINPTGLVGKDLEGNKYYEYPNPVSARPKRVVKYRQGYDMWIYVAGGKRLPVQWSAWLTHTRGHPPTREELYADLERQKRVLLGAAMIEAREREAVAAAQLAELPQSGLAHPPPLRLLNPPVTSTSDSKISETQVASSSQSSAPSEQTAPPIREASGGAGTKPASEQDDRNQNVNSSKSPAADDSWEGKPNPWSRVPKGADATQSWTPRAIRRG